MSKEVKATLMSGGSVASSGSDTTAEQDLDGGDLTGTVSYHMTGDGTPDVHFQVADGQDANGNDIWVTLATKTDLEGGFDLGVTRATKCRLEIVETSGGTGVSLDAIHVFTNLANRPE